MIKKLLNFENLMYYQLLDQIFIDDYLFEELGFYIIFSLKSSVLFDILFLMFHFLYFSDQL